MAPAPSWSRTIELAISRCSWRPSEWTVETRASLQVRATTSRLRALGAGHADAWERDVDEPEGDTEEGVAGDSVVVAVDLLEVAHEQRLDISQLVRVPSTRVACNGPSSEAGSAADLGIATSHEPARSSPPDAP